MISDATFTNGLGRNRIVNISPFRFQQMKLGHFTPSKKLIPHAPFSAFLCLSPRGGLLLVVVLSGKTETSICCVWGYKT